MDPDPNSILHFALQIMVSDLVVNTFSFSCLVAHKREDNVLMSVGMDWCRDKPSCFLHAC